MKIINEIQAKLRQTYRLLQSDTATLAAVRIMALGVLCTLFAYYVGYTLLLEPRKKELSRQRTLLEQTPETPPEVALMLAEAVEKLEEERKDMEEKRSFLLLKERYLLEHWEYLADTDRFIQTLFTLSSEAPVDIQENLGKMKLAPSRTMGAFELHPVRLAGETDFQGVYRYLQYMESRPEVGLIDDLVIQTVEKKSEERNTKVRFSMLVGRLRLKEELKE